MTDMIECGAFRRNQQDVLIGAGRHEHVGRYMGFLSQHRGEAVGGSFGTDPTPAIPSPIRDRAARVVVGSDRERQRRQAGAVPDAAGQPVAICLPHGIDVIDEFAQRVITDGLPVRQVDPDTPLAGTVVDAVPGFLLPPTAGATSQDARTGGTVVAPAKPNPDRSPQSERPPLDINAGLLERAGLDARWRAPPPVAGIRLANVRSNRLTGKARPHHINVLWQARSPRNDPH